MHKIVMMEYLFSFIMFETTCIKRFVLQWSFDFVDCIYQGYHLFLFV